MKHEWYTDLLYPPVQRAGARESKDVYGGAPGETIDPETPADIYG